MTSAETVERIRLPGIEADEQAILDRLLKQLSNRKPRNELRASYYDGKRAIRQIGTVIPPQYYKLGIVLGWSAKAVDILARRCNLDGFVWPDGDLNSLGYQKIVDDNFLFAETSAALVSALIHGVVFAVNTTGGADEPTSLVHFKDALNATGAWNARTRRMSNLLSVTSRDKDGNPTGLALYLDGKTITASKSGAQWTAEATTHKWGVPVEALVYKPRTDRPMGTSRISRPVMGLHDQALRTLIRLEGHADVFSYPEMWMLGADESIFKNGDGSQKASWQVVMGRIKGIPDNDDAPESLARADVRQFQAASPQPHIDTMKMQAQLFAGETHVPLTALGVTDMANPTSAESYIASREELISEAEGATDDWAPPLRRTMARALGIANNLPVDERWSTIDTKWRSPMHLSRAAQADAGSKQLAAVPWLAETEVGLKLIGLNEQDVTLAMSEHRRAQGRATLASILNRASATTTDGNAATN